MDEKTVDSIFHKVAAVLKEHTVVLVNHRHSLEHLNEEVAQINRRLGKSVDPNSIAELNARLKAISDNFGDFGVTSQDLIDRLKGAIDD